MDDGSVTKDADRLIISTCAYDEDSQIRIVEKLKLLGIDCYYKYYDNYPYIIINKDGFSVLKKNIYPYMQKCMLYKIHEVDFHNNQYEWNYKYKTYGLSIVDKILNNKETTKVYDMEIEDNHNFLVGAKCRKGREKLYGYYCS